MDSETRLKSHYRALLRLGLPIIVGQLGIIMVSFIDNVMVGHHSMNELAAASFVNSLLMLLYVFGIAFGYGLTPMVASSDHRQRHFSVGILFRHSLRVNLWMGVLLVGIAVGLIPLFGVFNLPDELRPVVMPYYWIQVGGLILVMGFNTLKQLYDGMSDTKTPMYVTVTGNFLNMVLNYLLIFGIGFLPELGLVGAGLATLMARVVMLLALMYIFARRKSWQPLRMGFARTVHLRRVYRRLFGIGMPVAVQMGLEAASFTIVIVFVGRLGGQALAAHQIVSVITTIGYMIYYGIGAATTIHISHYRLRGKPAEVRRIAADAYRMSALGALVVVVILLVFRERLSYLFTADAEVAAIVSLTLLPVIFYQFGDALQITYSNALRGLERVRSLAPASAVCHVLLAPSLSYLLAFVLLEGDRAVRLAGIWWAFPISLTLLGLLFYANFRKNTH